MGVYSDREWESVELCIQNFTFEVQLPTIERNPVFPGPYGEKDAELVLVEETIGGVWLMLD